MFDPTSFDPTARLHVVKVQHRQVHEAAHAHRQAKSLDRRRRSRSLGDVIRAGARRVVPAIRSAMPAPAAGLVHLDHQST